jgi:hypothetical protein
MNKEVYNSLVEEAGFNLWMDEPWGPPDAGVDWSCNYDRELQQFAMLVVAKCVQICNDGTATQMTSAGAARMIEGYFLYGKDFRKDID